MATALLADTLWDLIEPLVPAPASKPRGGKPRLSDWACLTRSSTAFGQYSPDSVRDRMKFNFQLLATTRAVRRPGLAPS